MKYALGLGLLLGVLLLGYSTGTPTGGIEIDAVPFVFVGGSGDTNYVSVANPSKHAWVLYDVVATTNGVATDVTAKRVHRWTRSVETSFEVTDAITGVVSTNVHYSTISTLHTNTVYASSTDTLPVNGVFLPTDGLILEFGSETNVHVRVVGVQP